MVIGNPWTGCWQVNGNGKAAPEYVRVCKTGRLTSNKFAQGTELERELRGVRENREKPSSGKPGKVERTGHEPRSENAAALPKL